MNVFDSPVVVTGEALIDLVLARDGSLDGHPGGGPYNVARTIGRLGQPVAYLGRVSTDGFGRRLLLELEADGVGLESIVPTDAPTTLALAELDAAGAAQYRFYDIGTSAPGLTLVAASAAFPERIGTFYLGTLGLVFEPMATTLEALVARVDEDTLVAIDPNCRPTMIDDPAAFRGRLSRLLVRTDVVKVSEEDLA
jgi:fructokinase